jgi:hypothetical protein
MNALIFQVLAVLAAANGSAASDNALLKELIEKGVEMPDGQVFCLPAPTMAEGLDADQQAAVLAKTAILGKVTLERFLDKSSSAPVALKLGKKVAGKNGDDIIRTVNLGFVVYGDWNILTSDKFSKGILKEEKAKGGKTEGMVTKAGYLKAPDLAVRGISTRSTSDLKEYVLFTTFRLFERVELSETRFGVATKTPTGVIVAAKVDPRFAKDKEYPNQWREIGRNAQGNPVLGPVQQPPYSGAAFYAKVTRLLKPENAIFVEFHQVFYEPRAWFGEDDNLMPAELRKMIPFEVKTFRGKLAKATLEEAEKKEKEGAKPAEEKPVEK